jgi:hypothetical protein
VKREFYPQLLETLLKWVFRVRLQVLKKGSWSLLHDDARAHSAITVKYFLGKCNKV